VDASGGVLSEVDWGDGSGECESEGVALYLSASVLRLRLDEVLLELGEGVLATSGSWLRSHRPHLFWNLLWYATRLAMPLPFPQAPRLQTVSGCPVAVLSRCLAGWEERVVCAQCQWLLGAAQHVDAHAAAATATSNAALSWGDGSASASSRSRSTPPLQPPLPSFSVRGLDKQWWPFSAEASLCVAAAMQHAAARGLDGGAVLLPARRTDNGADDRARGDAMDADDRACGDAMDADDRMCGDASENGSGRTGPPQLEVRWGRAAASEASGASGSPTGMLQVNLDHPNVVATQWLLSTP
jgi:hypothetical protein